VNLYGSDASWWRLLAPPESYDELAAAVAVNLVHGAGTVQTMVELGCGIAPMAEHFPSEWELILVDTSQAMLDEVNHPVAERVLADMRTLVLDRQVDAVLLQDAVMYLTSLEDLAAAFRAAFGALRPGGAFLVIPDTVREFYEETTLTGGGEDHERAIRMMEWHFDPDPSDHQTVASFSYVMRLPDGTVRHHHESHTMGLFGSGEIVEQLVAAGFEVIEAEPTPAGLPFLAQKPA